MCQLNAIATFLKPYAQDIGSVIPNMGYAANAYDATGHEARLHLAIGENQLKILSPETSKAVQGLLDLGVIGLSHNQAYNPYPEPGHAAEVAKPGDPTGFTEVTKKDLRVEAEC
jgi:hypothetical protein